MEEKTNCPNCGAPLDESRKCAYCGTVAIKQEKSEIVITSDSIKMTCTA